MSDEIYRNDEDPVQSTGVPLPRLQDNINLAEMEVRKKQLAQQKSDIDVLKERFPNASWDLLNPKPSNNQTPPQPGARRLATDIPGEGALPGTATGQAADVYRQVQDAPKAPGAKGRNEEMRSRVGAQFFEDWVDPTNPSSLTAQTVAGALPDVVINLNQTIRDNDSVADKLGGLVFFGPNGLVEWADPEDFRNIPTLAEAILPDVPHTNEPVKEIARTVASFISAIALTKKFPGVRSIKNPTAQALVAEGIAGFSMIDPEMPVIADMLQEHVPGAERTWVDWLAESTEFLAKDEGDSPNTKRMKNVLDTFAASTGILAMGKAGRGFIDLFYKSMEAYRSMVRGGLKKGIDPEALEIDKGMLQREALFRETGDPSQASFTIGGSDVSGMPSDSATSSGTPGARASLDTLNEPGSASTQPPSLTDHSSTYNIRLPEPSPIGADDPLQTVSSYKQGPKSTRTPSVEDFPELGSLDPVSNKPILQSYDDVHALHAEFTANVKENNKIIASIVKGVKGAVFSPDGAPGLKSSGSRVKDLDKILDKVGLVEGGRAKSSPRTISDVFGGRIIVDDLQAVVELMQNARNSGRLVGKPKMSLGRGRTVDGYENGYRAVHMQIMTDTGNTMEIQILPTEMMAASEGLTDDVAEALPGVDFSWLKARHADGSERQTNHVVYERTRKLDAVKSRGEITEEYEAELALLQGYSKDTFDRAWAAFIARTNPDQLSIETQLDDLMFPVQNPAEFGVTRGPPTGKPVFDAGTGRWSDADFYPVQGKKNSEIFQEEFDARPSLEELQTNLRGKKAQGKAHANRDLSVDDERLLPGGEVEVRIDIPLKNKIGKSAVTIHGKGGNPIAYDEMVILEGPVTFKPGEVQAMRVMRNQQPKDTFAKVRGKLSQNREMPPDLDSEEWVAVGFNPHRATFFYDKRTGQEIVAGTDSVSVGGTVFTRNPQMGSRKLRAVRTEADGANLPVSAGGAGRALDPDDPGAGGGGAGDGGEGFGGGAAAAGQPEEPGEIFINFSTINGPEDVKQIMQDMADASAGSIDKARRGVRTWKETKLDADEQYGTVNQAWEMLQNRRTGEPLNSEQTVAARELWYQSAKTLMHHVKSVRQGGGEMSKIALRRQLALHNAIQDQVLGARAETARALNAWAIPTGDVADFAQSYAKMSDLIASESRFGMNIDDVADKLTILGADGFSHGMDVFVHGSRFAKTGKAITQLFYFSMLSNPHTHARNMLSNTSVMGLNLATRKVASTLGRLHGEENIPSGETAAMAHGMMEGFKNAFRITAKGREAARRAYEARITKMGDGGADAAREILSENADEFGTVWRSMGTGKSGYGISDKVDAPPVGAFSPEGLGISTTPAPGSAAERMGFDVNPYARVMSYLDTATRMPTSALRVEDELFKTMNYMGEMAALAYRRASKEVDEGIITRDQFQDRLVELQSDPDAFMKLAAGNFARESTFTNQPINTGAWQSFRSINKMPVMGKLVMPFTRTAFNIANFSFQHSPLAPLTKKWRNDFMAGGARADMAYSKFLVGAAAFAVAADLAISGHLTGSGDPNPARRAHDRLMNREPNSVRLYIGGNPNDEKNYINIGYRGTEPLGFILAAAANMVEILKSDGWDDDDVETEEMVISTVMAIAETLTTGPTMWGVAQFFDTMSDPRRHGEGYVQRMMGLLAPSGLAYVARLQDPYQKAITDWQESVMARIPNTDGTYLRDKWGERIDQSSPFGVAYDAVVPLAARQRDPYPIDEELERLDLMIGNPRKILSYDGANVNLKNKPEIYQRYLELQGHALTQYPDGSPIDPTGEGLVGALSLLVTNGHPDSWIYNNEMTDGPDGGKAYMIRSIVERYREVAKYQLIEEFPWLKATIEERQEKRNPRFK